MKVLDSKRPTDEEDVRRGHVDECPQDPGSPKDRLLPAGHDIDRVHHEKGADEGQGLVSQRGWHLKPAPEVHEARHHGPERARIFAPEDDPAETDEMEADEDPGRPERTGPDGSARGLVRLPAAPSEESFQGQERSLIRAPDDERPGGAVPESAQEHGEEQVAVGSPGAVAAPAEGNVEVVAKPGRQADVPATPEVGDAGGEVGMLEVVHEGEAHDPGHPARDVGVAREVAVDLEGEGQRPQMNEAGKREGTWARRWGRR